MNLEKIAPLIEEIIKKSLEEKRYPYGFSSFRGKSDKVASGKLVNSINVKFEEDKDGMYYARIYGPNGQLLNQTYGNFPNNSVQAGRAKGKKGVPVSALIQWIKDRNLQPRDKKRRFAQKSEKNIKGMAFAIQKNIKKFGIRPSNFLDVALENMMENKQINELLVDAALDDLLNALEGL